MRTLCVLCHDKVTAAAKKRWAAERKGLLAKKRALRGASPDIPHDDEDFRPRQRARRAAAWSPEQPAVAAASAAAAPLGEGASSSGDDDEDDDDSDDELLLHPIKLPWAQQ